MPAIKNIVINDGLATPVAHTFAPAKTQADYAQLEDRSSGIYIGYNKLVFKLDRPSGNSNVANRNVKLAVRVETPKMETLSNNSAAGIAPAPTVSYRPWVEVNGCFPERSSKQDRKDLRVYLIGVLQSVEGIAAFEDHELPY